MADFSTSELSELTTLSDGDLFNVSEDQGGGSYDSKKLQFQTLKFEINSLSIQTKSSTYTLTLADDVILADASGGGFSVNLPAANTAIGKVFDVKKIDSTGNAVTLDGNGSETIDGMTTLDITSQYVSIKIISDGSGWYIL